MKKSGTLFFAALSLVTACTLTKKKDQKLATGNDAPSSVLVSQEDQDTGSDAPF